MSDPNVARLQAWLVEHETELLDTYRELLRFPSIESDAEPGAPFGKENRAALDFMLSLGSKWGMTTKNLEGYAGYAEFGSGERLVMSLGHLDVVPVGPGWKHGPFDADIDEGYVYARGAVDDKGPTIASFFAARAIKECFPEVPARIRSVFGCDEESGFKCIERYVQTEEAPTFGIAPDSGWPLYHAEKGIANFVVEVEPVEGEMALLEINGGQRPNIVIDSCQARIRVAASARKHVDEKLADSWDRNLEFAWEGDVLSIKAIGKAAHGSEPFGGDSAAIRIFRFLKEISPISTGKVYDDLFETCHIGGGGLGISGADDVSKGLTCNVGIVTSDKGRIQMTFNVRYPVTWKGNDVRDRVLQALTEKPYACALADFNDSPPLYFPLDHPLVKAICEVYAEESGENPKPGVMGGGTYARAVPNTVSIGTGWEGDGHAHETDERLKIDHLYKMSRIYAHILYRLATMSV
ncbi:MAG: Sapep family Mn(2+)-dependent dipeptidase [Fimbriimonadaceae bacterium]|nr:Sapep family Mn(2+)-dependent dipeptidase [Fimbriimonadaceae bacterium]